MHRDSIPASDTDKSLEKVPKEHPAPAAAILVDALQTLMQTMKMASVGPKTERRQPNFDDEEDLSLF